MRSTTFKAAVLFSALSLAQAQTFTDCDPTKKTCPADPALGTTHNTDFTKGKDDFWQLADGTSMTYGTNGAEFSITAKKEAPTIESEKYIFFGKVTASVRASPGTGIVSSFILESDDLDEIDWEWLGSDNFNVQTNFFGKGDVSTYDRGGKSAVSTPIDTFHTYTIDWTADRIIWSIDNNPVRTLTPDDPTAHAGTRYPQTPMKIKMGSWIGCLDASDPKTQGTCEWAGGQAVFSDSTKYQMFVQSVTVEDYGCGEEYTYGDMSGTWQSIKTSGGCSGGGNSSPSNSGSSSSVKPTPSSTSSKPKPTSSGGAFLESSSTSSSTKSSTTSHSASSTTESSKTDSKPTESATSTTLSTATTPASTTTTPPSSNTSPTSSPTSSVIPVTNDGNSKSKSKFGALDFAVIALGLGLGYLVM